VATRAFCFRDEIGEIVGTHRKHACLWIQRKGSTRQVGGAKDGFSASARHRRSHDSSRFVSVPEKITLWDCVNSSRRWSGTCLKHLRTPRLAPIYSSVFRRRTSVECRPQGRRVRPGCIAPPDLNPLSAFEMSDLARLPVNVRRRLGAVAPSRRTLCEPICAR